jgi:glucosamine--fructose-6-phosphate aminotransferase (isomerizing)
VINLNNYGKLTFPEISSQAEAIEQTMRDDKKIEAWVQKYIGNEQFDEVMFIGSGSSYYQALTMASTYRKWTGRAASAYPSSEVFLFRENASISSKKTLLVGVSRSGESSEVILALESVQSLANWAICGITCYETSKMAQICECIVSTFGKEKSTVMTKSFSSMTFLMQYAISFLSTDAKLKTDLRKAADLTAQVVQHSNSVMKKLTESNTFNKYIYLGMGSYFGLAQEGCLKIKEMSYVWTESFGTLEFRHGPKSIVDKGTLVCLFVSEQARAYELKVAEEMKEYGAFVMLIVSQAGTDTQFADLVVEIGGRELNDDARATLYLPAVQYLGYYTALELGVDPDHPRNLSQVVKI